MTIHVTSIESNVKTGVKLSGLGTKVLIVGDNEKGKSAVTDSVTLALQGFVARIAGKDRRKESDLMTLVQRVDGQPAFAGTLTAKVGLSDGTEASWSTTGSLAGAKSATWETPKTAGKLFELGAIRDVLVEKGDEPRRRFFLEEAAAVAMSEPDLFALVPAPYKDLWQRLRGPASVSTPQPSGVAVLRAIGGALPTALTAARNKVKALNLGLERLQAGTTTVASQSDLDEARRAAEQAKSRLARHQVDTRVYEAERGRLQREINAATEAVGAWEKAVGAGVTAVEDAQRDLDKTLGDVGSVVSPDIVAALEALAIVAKRQADMLAQGHLQDCVLCEAHLDPAAAQSKAITVQQQVDQVLAGTRAFGARAEIVRRLTEARSTLAAAQSNLAAWMERLRIENTLLLELEVPPALSTDEVTKAIQTYEAMVSATTRQEEINRVKGEVLAAETEVTRLEGFQREITEMTERLLVQAKAAIEKAVSAFLPEGETFRLLLEYDGKALCLIGLERNGVLDIALSDSTWDRVVLAVGCALAEPYELAVLIGEDRAYDPGTLAKTMRALSKAKAQVFLTSPVAPAGRTPAGWQVIDVSEVRNGLVEAKVASPKTAKAGRAPQTDTPAAGAATETPPAGPGEDPAAGTGAPEPEPGQVNIEPGLAEAAPSWVRLRGRLTWTGTAEGTGTGGLTYAQAVEAVGVEIGSLSVTWADPRESLGQQFYTIKASVGNRPGPVVRRLGRRLFVYAELDSTWGKFLGEGPRDRVPFSFTITNQSPLGNGHVILLDNLMRVYQIPAPQEGLPPYWMLFSGSSGLETLPATVPLGAHTPEAPEA